MTVLELEDRKIIRPKKGKKVKFKSGNKLYTEIVVDLNDNQEIEEVKA